MVSTRRLVWFAVAVAALAAFGSCSLVAPRGHWNPGDDQYDPASDPSNSPDAAPVAPSHLVATAASPGQVALSWRDNSAYEELFEIERKTGAEGTYAKIGESPAETPEYTDDTVGSEILYVYRVRAANSGAGNSDWSAEASVTSQLALPEIAVTLGGVEIPSGTGSYDFTAVLIGQTSSATFRIENTGDAPLELGAGSPVQVVGTDFAVTAQPAGPVAVGGYAELTVSFSPTGEGGRTGSVSVASNDADENPYTFSLTGTGTVQYYTLTVQAGSGGATDPSGPVTVAEGGTRDIVATPSGGYLFAGWSVVSGTGVVFGDVDLASTTVTLNQSDATIRADFSLIASYTLTLQNDGNGGTDPSGASTVDSGIPRAISATPNGGYYFVNWTVVSGSATFGDANAAVTTVTLSSGDATISANFDVTWSAMTADDGGANNVGQYASIAVGSTGTVYVSYYDATQKKLKFTHYDGATWTTGTVTDSKFGGTDYGTWGSLAVDSGGNAHVSYYWTDGGYYNSKYLRYGKWNGTSWTLEDAATLGTPETAVYSSMVLDAGQKPHIGFSYHHIDGGTVYHFYVKHVSFTTVWTEQTAKSSTASSDYFRWTSLALDTSDRAHLSYQTEKTGDLEYASYNGSSWVLTQPTSGVTIGAYSSLALDSSGYAHVSCQDASASDLIYYVYDGSWSTVTVVDSTGSVGAYTSIKLDSHGYPHISYYDVTNGDLKYAYEDGTGWHTETVDTGGNVGSWTSLVLDGQDRAHIAYYDVSNTALKYAHRNVAP